MPTLSSNGITLAYEIHGSGQPLILVSGVGYGTWYWHRLVPELAPHFQVITVDNRGTGASDKPDGPYTTAMLAADIIGLLDGLGLKSVHLLGHSLGGFVAQEVVLARPDLVSKLVLAATSFGGPNSIVMAPEVLRLFTDRSGDPAELFWRGLASSAAPGFAERNPEVVQEWLAYRLSNPMPPAQYAAQIMAGAMHNAEARVGAIACPTLILFGVEDKIVPPGNAPLLEARIPNAVVKILPGLGHNFPIEDPAATARAIFDFLAA